MVKNQGSDSLPNKLERVVIRVVVMTLTDPPDVRSTVQPEKSGRQPEIGLTIQHWSQDGEHEHCLALML